VLFFRVSDRKCLKKILENIFLRKNQFFPDFKNFFSKIFGALPVGNPKKRAPQGHPKSFALSAAKRIRALAAIPKNLKNRTGRVKKNDLNSDSKHKPESYS